eukprot:m.63796 g.63796  ORF g.63796 m.63796 type:complete len:80 (-) comp19490_c1_seq2:312-551(-)
MVGILIVAVVVVVIVGCYCWLRLLLWVVVAFLMLFVISLSHLHNFHRRLWRHSIERFLQHACLAKRSVFSFNQYRTLDV